MVTAELLSRARAGDGEAFRELAGPHRRELQVHCYRMLGDVSQYEPLVPTPRDEAVWLQPFPDALLEGASTGHPLRNYMHARA